MNKKLTEQRIKEVGQAIHEARQRADLSQAALAERCDLTHADISRLENGKANPTLRMLLRVLNALGVDRLTI
jgi:transcriptional regulator with XRE-family HTH domain